MSAKDFFFFGQPDKERHGCSQKLELVHQLPISCKSTYLHHLLPHSIGGIQVLPCSVVTAKIPFILSGLVVVMSMPMTNAQLPSHLFLEHVISKYNQHVVVYTDQKIMEKQNDEDMKPYYAFYQFDFKVTFFCLLSK